MRKFKLFRFLKRVKRVRNYNKFASNIGEYKKNSFAQYFLTKKHRGFRG